MATFYVQKCFSQVLHVSRKLNKPELMTQKCYGMHIFMLHIQQTNNQTFLQPGFNICLYMNTVYI